MTDIGGLNDHGFNHLSYQGLLQAESQLGVKGTVLQSQSGADYTPNLTRLAQAGNKLVIAVGFLMAAPLQQVAMKYPNVHFAIIDNPGGTAPDTAKNIEGIDFAEQQAGYPAGYLTGLYLKAAQLHDRLHGRRSEHPAGRPVHRRLPGRGQGSGSVGQAAQRVLAELHR